MKRFVLLPCAGSGTRMGSDRPKFLLDLQGKSVLARTLETLESTAEIDAVVLVIAPQLFAEFIVAELPKLPRQKLALLVSGGSERQHSIWNGLRALRGESGNFEVKALQSPPPQAAESDLIAVHDAVRPFARAQLFQEVFAAAAEKGAALAAIPMQDTVKRVVQQRVQETIDRSQLYLAQTPQAFGFGLLYRAYREAQAKGLLATDDASLVEALGTAVAVVTGSKENMKITTPEDLALAQILCQKATQSE